MTTQNTGFKAFSTKVNSTAIHTIQAANEPTETQSKPSSEPDKTAEPSKEVPQTK